MIFQISIPENPTKYNADPGYLELIRERDMPCDLEPLTQAIFLFKKLYWLNVWRLRVGDDTYEFQVRNFDYFWEEIPEMLQTISRGEDCSFVLSLTEDLQFDLSVECDEDNPEIVVIRFVRLGFDDSVAKQHYTVSKTDFISEWQKYVETVIQLLYENKLVDKNASVVREYLQGIQV